MEEWKQIADFPDYEVSTLGRVRRGTRMRKICLGKRGYAYVDLWKHNTRRKVYLHTLLAEAFIPNPDNKPQIDHINRNPLDNRLENLRWATNEDNSQNKEYTAKTNTGHLYIHRLPYGGFYLQIKHRSLKFQKVFADLDDALLNREEILSRQRDKDEFCPY
jgi:hypothetical protein